MGRASGRKRPRRKRKPCTVPIPDPLGLEGLDIGCEKLKVSEMSSWFEEIACELDKRWSRVETLPWKRLAAILREKRWPIDTESKVEIWRKDQRQDHEWRLRLLDGKTPEGRLYKALCRIHLENMSFTPDQGGFKKMSTLMLTMLDLMEFPDPFHPPELRAHEILPGAFVKRPEAQRVERGALFYVPQDGIVIPRRYSRARVNRAIKQFIDLRNDRYWHDVKEHVASLASKSVDIFKTKPDPKAVEEFFGEPSMSLVRTLREPMVNLFDCMGVNKPHITKVQTKRASARLAELHPLVRRLSRLRSEEARRRIAPARIVDEFNELRESRYSPKDIALIMIIDEMDLGIAHEALWRHIQKHRQKPKSN